MDVVRAKDLMAQGASEQQLTRLVRTGRLERVRHGAYAGERGNDSAARHRQLVEGTWPLLGERAVLSHATAGLLHGLPVWDELLTRVSITRAEGGHGRVGSQLRVRCTPLDPDQVVEVDGFRMTNLERTAIDLARCLDYERAVAVLDAALRAGADRSVLVAVVEAAHGFRGVGTARTALDFADRRAESVGESFSRVRLAAAGLPAPELQVDIFDEDGNWVARSDFGWLERGVLGEFDGTVKYVGPDAQVTRAVLREKHREANMRDLGWALARWGSRDLAGRSLLRHRVETAFQQATPNAIRGFARPARG